MPKDPIVLAIVVSLAPCVLGQGVPNEAAFTAGAWQADTHRSDAQLTTEATTDYGKTKMNVTVGFARVNGIVKIDDNDPTKSSGDFTIYPATSISPSLDEDGNVLSDWLASRSPNHTLVCFHSKQVLRTPDGRLQATGNLSLTPVDRDVEAAIPSEGLSESYADPPPVMHRTSHEVTFVFDFPVTAGNGHKDGGIQASGSTTVSREEFAELVKTALNTYWPPLIQDENCEVPIAIEAYGGSQCTGNFLDSWASQSTSSSQRQGLPWLAEVQCHRRRTSGHSRSCV